MENEAAYQKLLMAASLLEEARDGIVSLFYAKGSYCDTEQEVDSVIKRVNDLLNRVQ